MSVVDTWSGHRAVLLQRAMRKSNEAFAERLGVSVRAVASWHSRPDVTPAPFTQELLDLALSRAPDEVRLRLSLLAGEAPPSPDSLDAMVINAAQESSADALSRTGDLGPNAIPHLAERVRIIARSYNDTPAAVGFVRARNLRDHTTTVLDTVHRPRPLADLYALLGQTTALMGSMAFDLGCWDAASLLTRSAGDYADLAGHASLLAWTCGLQATLAFWRQDVRRALDAIDRGLAVAPSGSPRARLRYIAARAHAVDGNTPGVAAAILAASDDLDAGMSDTDELQDDIGGEFRFDSSRAAACAGAAWLQVGDGTRAEASVRQTLDHLLGGGVADSIAIGARLDLASALLLQGELAGATTELDVALNAGGPTTGSAIVGRVRRVQDQLASPRWRREPSGDALRDTVAEWLCVSR